jgi:predicted double-glycine peptidase
VPATTLAAVVPVYRDGTIGRDYVQAVESLGFRAFLIQPPFEDLLTHLDRGRPLVVTLPERGSSRHALVLIGHDPAGGTVVLNDPATGRRETIPAQSFRRRWEDGQRWTLLIVPKS